MYRAMEFIEDKIKELSKSEDENDQEIAEQLKFDLEIMKLVNMKIPYELDDEDFDNFENNYRIEVVKKGSSEDNYDKAVAFDYLQNALLDMFGARR